MFSIEEEVNKIKEIVNKIDESTSRQYLISIFNRIKNVYNLQTFDSIYNKVSYMKLKHMDTIQKKKLDDMKLAKSMVSNYDQTAKKKMEMNFILIGKQVE